MRMETRECDNYFYCEFWRANTFEKGSTNVFTIRCMSRIPKFEPYGLETILCIYIFCVLMHGERKHFKLFLWVWRLTSINLLFPPSSFHHPRTVILPYAKKVWTRLSGFPVSPSNEDEVEFSSISIYLPFLAGGIRQNPAPACPQGLQP
jgi:hypothetical protein